MDFPYSNRLKKLPTYLFIELDRKKKAAIDRGVDVISLGIGDPDLPTPDFIIEAAYKASKDKANHQYPLGTGLKASGNPSRVGTTGVSTSISTPRHRGLRLNRLQGRHRHLPIGVLNPGMSASPFAGLSGVQRRYLSSRTRSPISCPCSRRMASCPTIS
jgi:LL-diaminopimelate aminotransferase